MEVKYIVRRAFDYGGTKQLPGRDWEPKGGRNDQKLIDTGYVVLAEVKPEAKPKTARKKEA